MPAPQPGQKWQPGTKVKLVSGGPVMAVKLQTSTGPEAQVLCQWFDKDGVSLREGSFAPASLVPAEDAK